MFQTQSSRGKAGPGRSRRDTEPVRGLDTLDGHKCELPVKSAVLLSRPNSLNTSRIFTVCGLWPFQVAWSALMGCKLQRNKNLPQEYLVEVVHPDEEISEASLLKEAHQAGCESFGLGDRNLVNLWSKFSGVISQLARTLPPFFQT